MRTRYIVPTMLFMLTCSVLAQSQNPVDRAWTILKQGAGDKSADKRTKAFRAMALIAHNQNAQQLAENALSDEKPDVRTAAASALGLMGAQGSVKK